MLTKTNFKYFLECSCRLWLTRQWPELLPPKDAASRKAIDDGNAVDVFAKKLFPGGKEIADRNEVGAKLTTMAIAEGATVLFQPTFNGDGITCRCDILVKNGEKWDLYEVKSATSLKEEYIVDVTFQGICLTEAGIALGKTFVVYVNNQFVKDGEIDPQKFLIIEDVTRRAAAATAVVRKEIVRAKEASTWTKTAGLLHINTCRSPEKCEFLPICLGTISNEAIYSIANELPKDRLKAFLERGLLAPDQIPQNVLDSLGAIVLPISTEPTIEIDKVGILREFSELEYPLYFLDYETSFPAIPPFDGYKPYQQMVFQYSIHTLRTLGGEPEHMEFLHDAFTDPAKMVTEALVKAVGPTGSVIVWNERFEAGRNEELSRMVPEHADALRSINERMFDLMQIVKGGLYVDSRFKGSASLKNVLPVMAPELAYTDLAIQEGNTASASWMKLVDPKASVEQKGKLKRDMLSYCERDTFATVDLYKKFLAAAKL